MADASDRERGFVYGAAQETAIDGALPPTNVNAEGVPSSPVGPTPVWFAQKSLGQRRTSSGVTSVEKAVKACGQLQILLSRRAKVAVDMPAGASSPRDQLHSPASPTGASLQRKRMLDTARYHAQAEILHKRAMDTCEKKAPLASYLQRVKTEADLFAARSAEARRTLIQQQQTLFQTIDTGAHDGGAEAHHQGPASGDEHIESSVHEQGLSRGNGLASDEQDVDVDCETAHKDARALLDDQEPAAGSLLNYFASRSIRGYAVPLKRVAGSLKAKHDERMLNARLKSKQQANLGVRGIRGFPEMVASHDDPPGAQAIDHPSLRAPSKGLGTHSNSRPVGPKALPAPPEAQDHPHRHS